MTKRNRIADYPHYERKTTIGLSGICRHGYRRRCVNSRSQQIVQIAGQHGKVMVREAQKITGANRNTIKAHIAELVRRGRLKMVGKGKGAWYKLP